MEELWPEIVEFLRGAVPQQKTSATENTKDENIIIQSLMKIVEYVKKQPLNKV